MAAPSENVFVSDLPGDLDQAKLEYIFGGYGNVMSAKLLPSMGKHNALVRFQTQAEAKWVVENLHGNIPQGLTTPIQVKFANNPLSGKGGKGDGSWTPNGKGSDNRYSPYGKGSAGGAPSMGGMGKGQAKGGGDGGSVSIKHLKKGLQMADALPGGKWSNDAGALWVGNLPDDTTDLDMYHIFSTFGPIPSNGVRAMLNEDGSCKGYGFVNYIDPKDAQNVINILNGTEMPDGSLLEVREKGPSRKGEQEGGKDSGKGEKGSKGGFKGSPFGKGGGWW